MPADVEGIRKEGLIIEGGGKTLIIYRAGQANNRVVFSGFANRITDAVGMYIYLPGETNQDSSTTIDVGGGQRRFSHHFLPGQCGIISDNEDKGR
jgi:hypothetical protein